MAITDSAAITTATTAARGTASGNASTSLAGDMQSFLMLLTTQLQNQDPLQPLDPTQFTTQLSQFAAVEQQIATNRNMEALLELQNAAAMLTAAPLMGQEITVATDSVGLQDGTAQKLNLPALKEAGGASGALVTITDAAGTVLRQAAVPLGEAATAWRWDGRDSRGALLADGAYKLSVAGTDARGVASSTLDVTVTDQVDSITRSGAGPKLGLGALTVGLEALRGL